MNEKPKVCILCLIICLLFVGFAVMCILAGDTFGIIGCLFSAGIAGAGTVSGGKREGVSTDSNDISQDFRNVRSTTEEIKSTIKRTEDGIGDLESTSEATGSLADALRRGVAAGKKPFDRGEE